MPTYEYECDKCRRVFEVRQRISEPALTTCDACGGAVRRLLSPAPFILKGDGWYITDYPSEARKKARDVEKSGSSADSKASSDKATTDKPSSDTKPTSSTSAAGSSSASAGSSASSKD